MTADEKRRLQNIVWFLTFSNWYDPTKKKKLDNLAAKLGQLYSKAENVMLSDGSVAELLALLNKIITLYVQVEQIALNYCSENDSGETEAFRSEVNKQQAPKGIFDQKSTEWLKRYEMSTKDIASVVTAPRTLRSHSSRRSRHGLSSSIYRTQAVARTRLARLKLKHLQQWFLNWVRLNPRGSVRL